MKMRILVITALDEYLAQSSKNDNSSTNSQNQVPSRHYYLLNAYCVPGAVRCSTYIISVRRNNNSAK